VLQRKSLTAWLPLGHQVRLTWCGDHAYNSAISCSPKLRPGSAAGGIEVVAEAPTGRNRRVKRPRLNRTHISVVLLALALLGGCRRPKDIAWSFATPRPWVLASDSQFLTPVVDGDVVFFCGGYAEREGSAIYALEAQTGKLKWQFGVGSCVAPPIVASGVLVSFAAAQHGDRIEVSGLDKVVGRQQWKVELPGNPQPPAPVLMGNFVFFAPGSRSVLRIDVRDGSIQTFDVDANVAAANPWLAGTHGEVLFGYGKSYWRSRTDSETPEAGTPLSEPVESPVGLGTDGRSLLLADQNGNLISFNLQKGNVTWEHHWNKILSAPLIADGKVFVDVYEQKYALAALALASGNEMWRIQQGSTEAPYWQDGRIYVASGTSVSIVDGASGKIQRRFAAPTEVITTPIPDGDLVLFGTARGVLYAATTH
jgi:outer membrane protein assembly factor BamB